MSRITVRNQTRPQITPLQVSYCDTFFTRLRGLMFHPGLAEHEGILLVESSDTRINAAIHMLFMRFDIAVIWINSDHKVVDVKIARRWGLSYAPAKPACYILETRPEYAPEYQVGDTLTFTHE